MCAFERAAINQFGMNAFSQNNSWILLTVLQGKSTLFLLFNSELNNFYSNNDRAFISGVLWVHSGCNESVLLILNDGVFSCLFMQANNAEQTTTGARRLRGWESGTATEDVFTQVGVYLYASGSTSQVSTSDHSSCELLVSVQHLLRLLGLLCELCLFSFFNNLTAFELMCVRACMRACVRVCVCMDACVSALCICTRVCTCVCTCMCGHLLHIDTLVLGFFG